MVCHRCVLSVENILQQLSIPYDEIKIGELQTSSDITSNKLDALQNKLKEIGLELIDNRQTALIEKIKQLVIIKARHEEEEKYKKLKLSSFITHHIPNEYTYLSSLFSEIEGRTIENYFIEQRIEKVKELIVYDQLTLSEIAFQLDYSSVAHLSSQFKKVTGLTPSHFKAIGEKRRKTIDNI